MRKALTIGLAAAGIAVAGSASAAPVFVGSWILGNGPTWTTNPPVYTGQTAAALLFGGKASEYAISTVNSNPADINYSAWVDTWGETPSIVAQNYDYSACGGTYNCGYTGSATSAYVHDHSCYNRYSFPSQSCTGAGVTDVNYAFRVAVPEPASVTLVLSGLAGAGLLRRRRRDKAPT